MNSLRFIRSISKIRQCPVITTHRNIGQQNGTRFSASKRPRSIEDEDNEPIQYFGSDAAVWRAKDTRSGGADEHLSYQPYVISASLAIFLLYFCALREENDIDLKLDGKLIDHVEGLEEVQLTLNYKYNKANGLDNTEIINRLKELGIDINSLDVKLEDQS